MPLSIDKLVSLLGKQKLVPVMYFKLMGTCAFIKVLSFENAEEYLLYIQSKYEIKLPKDIPNVFKLKDIDINEESLEISERYGEINENSESNEIDLDYEINGNSGTGSLEDRLQEGFKKDVLCHEKIDKDLPDLFSINRQLRRIKLCLSSIRYKIGILYKNYLCVLNRNDEIDFFSIKKFSSEMNSNRKIMIHFDLELFYENQETLTHDIKQVSSGVFKNLDKNQVIQVNSINKILENKQEMNKVISNLMLKKNGFRKKIKESKNLLIKVNDNCRGIMHNINELNLVRNTNRGTISDETTYFQLREKYENKLNKCEKLRMNLQESIISLSQKENNLTLLLEEVGFDNVIMLDRIFSNLGVLSQKCKE
jgi:hypothetical protein